MVSIIDEILEIPEFIVTVMRFFGKEKKNKTKKKKKSLNPVLIASFANNPTYHRKLFVAFSFYAYPNTRPGGSLLALSLTHQKNTFELA